MKNILILALLSVSLSFAAQVKVSTKIAGVSLSTTIPTNKVFDLDTKKPKTMAQQIGKATKTSNQAIYKKATHDVYVTDKGKLFIVYPNTDNTGYNKKYLKPEDL